MYPLYPGRAELVLGSPLFAHAVIDRPEGRVTIDAEGAGMDAPYVTAMSVNGTANEKPWLPASFARSGGALRYTLSKTPDKNWGANATDAPPSFGP